MSQGAVHPDNLLWYVSGKLDAGEREAIRAHIGECADCAREAQRFESLRRTMRHGRKEPAGPSHPGVEELVALESRSQELDERARERLETHLAACPECREDYESLMTASLRMAPRAHGLPSGTSMAALNRTRLMGLAAAVLVALSGFAVVMLLRQAPTERMLLLPGLRSAEQTAALTGDGPWPATVVLPFDAPDGVYSLELSGPGGAPAGAAFPPSATASQGRIDTELPRLSGPGVYRLSVRPTRNPAGAGWTYVFRVGPERALAPSP